MNKYTINKIATSIISAIIDVTVDADIIANELNKIKNSVVGKDFGNIL